MAVNPTWTRIDTLAGCRVTDWTIDRGRPNEFAKTGTGTAVVHIVDRAGLFDPTNTSSPYNGKIVPGKQAGIALVNPTTSTSFPLFRGFVEAWNYKLADTEQWFELELQLVDGFALLSRAELRVGIDGLLPVPAASAGKRGVRRDVGDGRRPDQRHPRRCRLAGRPPRRFLGQREGRPESVRTGHVGPRRAVRCCGWGVPRGREPLDVEARKRDVQGPTGPVPAGRRRLRHPETHRRGPGEPVRPHRLGAGGGARMGERPRQPLQLRVRDPAGRRDRHQLEAVAANRRRAGRPDREGRHVDRRLRAVVDHVRQPPNHRRDRDRQQRASSRRRGSRPTT